MEKATIRAQTRETQGKGGARTLRRDGSIPAVIYGKGSSSSLQINAREFKFFVRETAGRQALLDLNFEDKSTKLALLKKVQYHPVSGKVNLSIIRPAQNHLAIAAYRTQTHWR